jgi:hypothetical protein
MRGWLLAAVAATTACQGDQRVAIVVELPGGVMNPAEYTSIDVRVRTEADEFVRSAPVLGGRFELGDIPPTHAVAVEASLRASTGALVAYGRADAPRDLVDGETISVPVRRPLIYLGTSRRISDGNANTADPAVVDRAAFIDLTSGGDPTDPMARIETTASHLVLAGTSIYGLEQGLDAVSERGAGGVTIRTIASANHAVGPAPVMLPIAIEGALNDATASTDGRLLAVATQRGLYLVTPLPPAATLAASGSFSRASVAASGVYAIQDRAGGAACDGKSRLVRANAGDGANGPQATTIATGSFVDLATDGTRVLVLDCDGRLGEIREGVVTPLRSDLTGASAVAFAGRRAWVARKEGSVVSIVTFELASQEPPRTLWSQAVTQTMTAKRFPGVVRTLSPNAVSIDDLEVGGGGEYVAATVRSSYDQPSVPAANFPRFVIDSDELWVLSGRTGAVSLRYRPWCNGIFQWVTGQISEWECARESGQRAARGNDVHRIRSMALWFGAR